MGTKIGVEIEMHLIDKKFDISNNADEVIDSSINPLLEKEVSKSMIEVVMPPYNSISSLENDLMIQLQNLKKEINDLELGLLASTSIGIPKSEMTRIDSPKYDNKRILFGNDFDISLQVCGTHVHVDLPKDQKERYNMYKLIQGLDPLFALMASSPFLYLKNTKKDHRVHSYRNILYEKFSRFGQLQEYPLDEKEYSNINQKFFDGWKKELAKRNLDDSVYDLFDSNWGPIRIKENTIESRCADTNLPENILALACAYKGLYDLVDTENLQVEISDKPSDFYMIRSEKLFVPSFTNLKKMERKGIVSAVKDEDLNNYLARALKLAARNNDEETYLIPFFKMLKDKNTFADDIMKYANSKNLVHNSKIEEEGARNIRAYIYNRFLESVN